MDRRPLRDQAPVHVPGKISPVGLVLVGASVRWLTGIGAHTPFWQLEIALFVNGLGMGLTMTPIFTGAIQTIRAAQAARAHLAPPLAAAFGHTFWWALALIVVAFIASLFLPKRRPERAEGAPPMML